MHTKNQTIAANNQKSSYNESFSESLFQMPELPLSFKIQMHITDYTVIAVELGLVILWFSMIHYCYNYQRKLRKTWTLLLIIGGPLFAIIYLFKKDEQKEEIPEMQKIPEPLINPNSGNVETIQNYNQKFMPK